MHFVCRDLAAKADGKSDPFATLLFGKEQFNTQVRTLMCVYCVRVVPLVFDGSTSSPIPRRLLHGWESGNWDVTILWACSKSTSSHLLPTCSSLSHTPSLFLSPSFPLPPSFHLPLTSLSASFPQKYPQVIPKTRFPRWKKTFELKMPQPSHEAGAPPPSIKIIVYNFDTFSQNQFMGEVRAYHSISILARLSWTTMSPLSLAPLITELYITCELGQGMAPFLM